MESLQNEASVAVWDF